MYKDKGIRKGAKRKPTRIRERIYDISLEIIGKNAL